MNQADFTAEQQRIINEYMAQAAQSVERDLLRCYGFASQPASLSLDSLKEQEIQRLKELLNHRNDEILRLRTQLRAAEQRAQWPRMETAELDKALKALIALAHPDKWPDVPLAHEITVALNRLRQSLQ